MAHQHQNNHLHLQPPGSRGPGADQQQEQRSYSTAAQIHKYPGMDLGIVIEAKDDVTIADYAMSLGSIVGKQNLTHISHVSKQRV